MRVPYLRGFHLSAGKPAPTPRSIPLGPCLGQIILSDPCVRVIRAQSVFKGRRACSN